MFSSKVVLLSGNVGKIVKIPRCLSSSTAKDGELGNFKKVMSAVPQPVVVVTTAKFLPESNSWLKRGVTCSSFTSISLKPPVISFTMNQPSRMHNLLKETKRFAVHVLSKNQVGLGVHFAKHAHDDKDQFASVMHEQDEHGIPVIDYTPAILHCSCHSVHTIGDHNVWYGQVLKSVALQGEADPLLYYLRSFRSVGDEAFMQAFEDRTLPFEDWTHEAHLRMAFNYIKEYGKEEATPRIKNGILKFNEVNKEKISRGYNETVTCFYIHMVDNALKTVEDPNITFDDFITVHKYLQEGSFLFQYYSPQTISKEDAKHKFLPPDKQQLP